MNYDDGLAIESLLNFSDYVCDIIVPMQYIAVIVGEERLSTINGFNSFVEALRTLCVDLISLRLAFFLSRSL